MPAKKPITTLPAPLVDSTLRIIGIALRRANRPEAIAAIERAFAEAEAERERVTLDSTLEQLGLSTRTISVLAKHGGIGSIRMLVRRSEADLLVIPNVAESIVAEVVDALRAHGLRLRL